MRGTSTILALGIIIVFFIGCVMYTAAEEGGKESVNVGNTACPVLGTGVEPGKALTAEYNGKLYNVCCPMCIAEFKKDPKKYSAIAEAQAKEIKK